MVLPQPEEGVGRQVVADLVAAVVEDERTPVRVASLPGVGVIVEVGAVEVAEAVRVFGEVGRDPVDDDAYPRRVEGVHQFLEVVRRPETVGRGIEAERLVAPRAVEGVLRRRQELDVGVAHLGDVRYELVGQFLVGEVGSVLTAAPGTKMDFVGRHRGVEGVFGLPVPHPLFVPPLVSVEGVDYGAGAGQLLGQETKRVGLEGQKVAVRAFQLVLIDLALADVWDEDLPHSDAGMLPHYVPPTVPVVEAADYRDAAGARGPDGEAHTPDAFERHRMRAEFVVDVVVIALSEEIQVLLSQRRRKTVGVFQLDLVAVPVDA